MRLKSLVINGFKSFADKTTIDFHEGVTGIVGPNGCGKSNVVDAVRWVLGETSAKALRGGEMADVIFNGTDKRKPLGVAEVVLTFTDCEQLLGTDYNEVSIARRVYRDGKGEYELNGTQCRLKDIGKLFMDTGIGRNMYSIMEQGKIDMLLSAKPEDRRLVFEEAAGITKSKAEKKEALRKLEYTEGNLVRVTDILTEMKRQMGSAQRQASKARRWKDLHQDVLVLDTHLHFKLYTEYTAERSELSNSIQSLRLRQTDLEAELEREEAGLLDARNELTEMEAQIGSLRNQLNSVVGEISAANYRIENNGERCVEWRQLVAQSEQEISAASIRKEEAEEDLIRLRNEADDLTSRIAGKQEEVSAHQQEASALREQRTMLQRHLDEARQLMHTSEGIIASAQAEIANHMAQMGADRQRQEQLQRDLGTLETEKEAKQRIEAELQGQLDELVAEIEGLQVELSSRERQAQEVEAELEVLGRRLRERHRLFSEKESKRDVLDALVKSGAGLEGGTQHVLKEFGGNGAHGLLSTYLEPSEPKFIPAIESALEGHLQSILVKDVALAENIIAKLRDNKIGTAIVLPQDLMRRGGAAQMQSLPEGAVAWALDKVRARDEVASVIYLLLGNVCVAPDLATAVRIKKDWKDVAVVTLEGEFISPEGAIRGGSAGNKESILQRQTELKELVIEVASLADELAGLEHEHETLLEQQRDLRQVAAEHREMLQLRRSTESGLQGQNAVVQREIAQYVSRYDSISWELAELLKRNEGLNTKVEEATARRQSAEENLEGSRQQVAEMQDELQSSSRREEEAYEQLNVIKTSLAVDTSTQQSLQQQLGPMNSRLRELEDLVEKRQGDISGLRNKIEQAEEETEFLTTSIGEARVKQEELGYAIEARSGERSERAQQLSIRDSALSGLRKQVSKYTEQRGQEEIRTTQLDIHLENLINSARERYGLTLEGFELDAHALLSAVNKQLAANQKFEKARSTLLTTDADYEEPEDLKLEGGTFTPMGEEDVDWDFVEACVKDLRSRLEGMGSVNLDAIQEYEELEERHNFLQQEYDDLNNAKTELMEIIKRINDESKKRFVETFIKVRDNFRNTFRELFGQAGQADLILADENDPLEGGIEIIAKPPGKKPASITLLSGGERSMTAVALMFSIYMVKPSPFCILDELDAPLDESNIGRFVRMLDKFISKSQFVIVTHNKRTMRRADVLYGVTMEEFGVSRPIGMKMSDSEKKAMKDQEDKALAEAEAEAMAAEAKLQAEKGGPAPEPVKRTATTSSWVEAMSET
jgi:chromosome segregation protein